MTTALRLIFKTLKGILEQVILTFIPTVYFETSFKLATQFACCNGLTLLEMATVQFILCLSGMGYKYVHK